MPKIWKKVWVESIEHCGDDEMFKAEIGVDKHACAIIVNRKGE